MRFDDLSDWLRWQETLHPSKIELGLDRVERVWRRLGPSSLPFTVITIAGTNGKGSCVAMLEAMYEASGYRTACYTSPHLIRYNERIRVRGREVTDSELCEAFSRVDEVRRGESLTYFEFGTLAAMDIFVRAAPEVVVLEVGLGGRLDAVNIFDSDLALITSIGLDHTAWLGETLDEIAEEKAGILRATRPAVIGHRDPVPALLACGDRAGCSLNILGRDFDWEQEASGWRWYGPGLPSLPLAPPALRGRVQYDNAASVLMCIASLRDRLPVSFANLRQGLQRARIQGRFQVLPGAPTWILDVAHNAPAAEVLAGNLMSLRCSGSKHAVLGMLADKDAAAVARPIMEWVDHWHLGAAEDSRAMRVEDLYSSLKGLDPTAEVRTYGDIGTAVAGARDGAGAGDVILVFGSFTTVEAALRRIGDLRPG